jgi:hypothetical protein
MENIEFWTESTYEDFADGTFGNGGQNLYVSRKGVLIGTRCSPTT